MYIELTIGIITLLISGAIRYWIYRRKFNRRNSVGLEEFSSFEKSVFTRIFEQILKLISYIFIILGIFYLWRYYQYSATKPGTSANIEATK